MAKRPNRGQGGKKVEVLRKQNRDTDSSSDDLASKSTKVGCVLKGDKELISSVENGLPMNSTTCMGDGNEILLSSVSHLVDENPVQKAIVQNVQISESKLENVTEISTVHADMNNQSVARIDSERIDPAHKPIQDWKQLFKLVKSFGLLSYHEPVRHNGRVMVQPPKEAVEAGILKWSASLIGQFLDKPLPFFCCETCCGKFVGNIWKS